MKPLGNLARPGIGVAIKTRRAGESPDAAHVVQEFDRELLAVWAQFSPRKPTASRSEGVAAAAKSLRTGDARIAGFPTTTSLIRTGPANRTGSAVVSRMTAVVYRTPDRSSVTCSGKTRGRDRPRASARTEHRRTRAA